MTIMVEETPGELDGVRQWRIEELERAGYGPFDAVVLGARLDVDLHVAVGLLRRGCPLDTALRILL